MSPLSLVVALLGGCEAKPAAVVVVVDSDLEVGLDVDAVQVSVEEEGGALLSTHDLALDGDGAVALPASFGIVREGHPGDDGSLDLAVAVPGDRFRTTAVARFQDATVFSTYAITGFREGFVTQLTLLLSTTCLALVCGPDQTCREEGCVAPELDPKRLSEWR